VGVAARLNGFKTAVVAVVEVGGGVVVGCFWTRGLDGRLGDIDWLACLATTSAKLRGLNC
jgi:hypothetical protein